MLDRPAAWSGAGGNEFLETFEIANHTVRVFKKLPSFYPKWTGIPALIKPTWCSGLIPAAFDTAGSNHDISHGKNTVHSLD